MNTNEIKNNNTMTDEEIINTYDQLSVIDIDSSTALKNAETETQTTIYPSIEEISTDNDKITTGVNINDKNLDDIEITNDNINDILKEYNLQQSDAEKMISIINDYKNHTGTGNYYNRLPDTFKQIADGIRLMGNQRGQSISKNYAACILIYELIHDAKFAKAMDEFEKEFKDLSNEMNKEYNKIFTDAFEEVFANIDKLEVEDPEKAEKIKGIKSAFENASNFDVQMEYAKKIGANKLTKLAKRFDNEALYFNNKVNVTDVKVPDIRELLQVIHMNLPDFDVLTIKKFIIIICKSTEKIDVKKDIVGLAYIYKLINNIYIYRYLDNLKDNEAASLLFGKVAKVLEYIDSK